MIKVKVEGFKGVEKALSELKPATARGIVMRALREAAMAIVSAAEAKAPRDRGNLVGSIGMGTRLSRRQRAMHKKQSPVELHVGAGPFPQASLQEFGTRNQPPQPFMRPAWEANKMPVAEKIADLLWAGIARAAARAAKRTARLAKK